MYNMLIVDDNTFFRQILRRILLTKFPSMSVREAADGEEALFKIEADPPQLIFMDVELPDESGIQLTRKIKTAHPESTIVVISNYDASEYRKGALQAGATEFISKVTSTPGDIVETVRSMFL
ncbi:MAG: response regulator [Thermodesulfobacteriota bacterium]